MRRNWIVVLIMLYFGLGSFAQEVIKKPVKYIKPMENVSVPSRNDELTDKPWYVFSDRSGNKVYSSASGENVTSRLGFSEKLAVMEVSTDGSRLLVAYEKDIDGRNLATGKSVLGWVDTDKLLLWEKSLVDAEYGIDKKAMILFTIDAARQRLQDSRNFTSDVPVFNKPSSLLIDTIGFHQGLFQFFPIFKTEGDFLLLGESLSLDSQKDFNGLKGWVKKENVSEWSHRVAWEKNWDPEAVRERESNRLDSIGLMVLQTESEAEIYARTNRTIPFSPFITNEAPYLEMTFNAERKPGPMGRYPILDITNIKAGGGADFSNPVKVGVIGEVMDLNNSVIEIGLLYNMSNEIKVLRQVNIIFVIDATESMESYRTSVIHGVKKALKNINELYKKESSAMVDKNDFSFGCVLYRDFHMAHTVQVFESSLSQDTAKFFKWLDNNMVLEMNKRREGVEGTDDLEEAMYYGIENALLDYGPDENMSNYMILIGDCGDHQKDKDPTGNLELLIDKENLIDEISSYNMNMLAFQVHHKNNPAYDLFQKQIKEILEGIGGADLEINEKNSNLYELPEEADYTGKLLICEKGKSIQEKDMSDLISQSIVQINKDVNGKIKNIAKALKGQSNLDPWSTAKVIKFFADNNFSEEMAETIITGGMNQEYEVGYTVLQCKGYTYPNYQQVVLFDRTELGEVVDSFRDLAAAIDYPVSEQRIRLKKALEKWFPKYFSGVQEDKLKDMEVGVLLEKITGLNFGDRYNEITISKITDPRLVSDKKLRDFVKDVSDSLNGLENIFSESRLYPARVEIPGDTKTLYVYIPGYIFPHE